jgi:hypothetical protein
MSEEPNFVDYKIPEMMIVGPACPVGAEVAVELIATVQEHEDGKPLKLFVFDFSGPRERAFQSGRDTSVAAELTSTDAEAKRRELRELVAQAYMTAVMTEPRVHVGPHQGASEQLRGRLLEEVAARLLVHFGLVEERRVRGT